MRSMKKLLCVFLVLSLLLSLSAEVFAAEKPLIALSGAEAKTGDSIVLELSVSNSPGISGVSISFSYDESALKLVDIRPLTEGSFSANVASARFSWLLGNNKSGDFALAELEFLVLGGVEGKYEISPALSNGDKGNVTNEKARAVEVSFVPGTVSVEKVSPSEAFGDLVPNAWYCEAVDYVLSEGMMYGVGSHSFAPNEPTTRAMVLTTLHRMAGSPALDGKSCFSDVPDGMWYSEAIVWAAAKGIAEGYGGGIFRPNDFVTREQMAALFHRYCGAPESDMSLDRFADADAVSPWAKSALVWAVDIGLIQGRGDGVLAPRGFCTRAELAQMLLNFSKIEE